MAFPFHNFPTKGMKIVHTSAITQQKQCQKFMILMNFPNESFEKIQKY